MERLTKSSDSGMVWYKSDLLLLEPCELSYTQVREVLRRLAAYEDTGLTPEEIKTITSTTELRINNTITEAEARELMGMLKQQPGTIMACTEGEVGACVVCGEIVPEGAQLCVCCGEIIPEGRQVCPACETEAGL